MQFKELKIGAKFRPTNTNLPDYMKGEFYRIKTKINPITGNIYVNAVRTVRGSREHHVGDDFVYFNSPDEVELLED